MKKFLENICSLDHIRQWEERDSLITETVSQHSFKVAAIAAYLLKDIKRRVNYRTLTGRMKWDAFASAAVAYAVLHDFDESIIGRDISHRVKYNEFNGGDIREALNRYVDHQLEAQGNPMPDADDLVKAFVKLCDWIALYTFCERNRAMGTESFLREREYCCENIRKKVEHVHELFKMEFDIDYDFKPVKEI